MKKIKNIEEKNMPDNNPFRVDKVAASKFIQRGLGVYQPENTTETEAEAKKTSEAATATTTTGGEERKPAGKRERNEGTAGDGGVTVAKKKVKKAK